MPGSTLVCFALRDEAKFFSAANGAPPLVEVLLTGVGEKNAARSLEAALAQRRPGLVLTCGFAGGLQPGLGIGSVVFCADHAPHLRGRLVDLGAVPARFHCALRIATSATEKATLWTETGADAVEMESGVIGRICLDRQIPCATVRVISDTAEQDLPLDFNALLTETLELDYVKLARTIARAPQKIPSLIQLQRQTRHAARQLAQTLSQLLRLQGA
jgi:adenosylhomocysteine nucleosidase